MIFNCLLFDLNAFKKNIFHVMSCLLGTTVNVSLDSRVQGRLETVWIPVRADVETRYGNLPVQMGNYHTKHLGSTEYICANIIFIISVLNNLGVLSTYVQI